MGSNDEDFALVLEAVNGIEAGLAKGLLAEAGIPSLAHGPDFDVAEFGRAGHDMLRGTNVYVPRAAYEEAKRILDESWEKGMPEEES